VPLYLIADAVGRGAERRVELILYQYHRRGFRRIAPDKNGRIYLEPFNLYVGVTRDRVSGFERLACYDPETDGELGDYAAVAEDLAAALKRAQEAEREALTAKRQVASAKRRAQAEAKRAAAEAEARAAAELRIRELEAQLMKRKKPT
jgi:uncharacterized membrane protein YqiK